MSGSFVALTVLGLLALNNRFFLSHVGLHPADLLAGAPGSVAGGLRSAAVAAAILALAGAVGQRVLRRISPEPAIHTPLNAIAIGTGILGTAFLALGLTGIFTPTALTLLPLILAILGFWKRRPPSLVWPLRPDLRGVNAFLAGSLLFAGVHAFVTALAPPTHWDVLAYHLAIPKLYLQAGRILEVPWLPHSHWPHLMELVYALPLAWGDDLAPALVHAGLGTLWIVSVFLAARRHAGPTAAWIAAALLAAQPAVMETLGTAHADGALAMFHWAAALTVWELGRSPQTTPRAWIAAGLLSGFGGAAKLHGAVLFLGLAVWIFLSSSADRRARIRNTILFVAAGLAVLLPWYAKTWATAGNPLWPFFSRLFGGEFGAAAVEEGLRRTNRLTTLASALRYGPFHLLVPLGMAVLLSPSVALSRFFRFFLIPFLPYALLFGGHNEGWRFFMPFYPALTIAAGAGLAAGGKRGRTFRGLSLAVLAFGLWPLARQNLNGELFAVFHVRSAVHPETSARDLYLSRIVDNYRLGQAANRRLGNNDRLLLFREVRGFYLDRPYQWGDPVNQAVLNYAEADSPAALGLLLQERGITHALINRGRYAPDETYYSPRLIGLMDDLLAREATLLEADGDVGLYRLGREPLAAVPSDRPERPLAAADRSSSVDREKAP